MPSSRLVCEHGATHERLPCVTDFRHATAAGLFCTHVWLRNGHVRVLGCCHLQRLLRPYHRPVHPHRRPLRSAPTASPALSTTSSHQCSSAPATSPTSSHQRVRALATQPALCVLWPCRFRTAVATALFFNGTTRATPGRRRASDARGALVPGGAENRGLTPGLNFAPAGGVETGVSTPVGFWLV